MPVEFFFFESWSCSVKSSLSIRRVTLLNRQPMSFSVFSQVGKNDDDIYKLVQLPKKLLEYMKTPGNCLEFKSPESAKNQLVLCTDSETYNVRQMNHSNTQFVVEDLSSENQTKTLRYSFGEPLLESSQHLLAIGQCSYLYELTLSEGEIETQELPIYDGSEKLLEGFHIRTVEDVIKDSPIARKCFEKRWHSLCGSKVENRAVLLHPSFITEAIYALISVLIAEKKESFTVDQILPLLLEHNERFTRDIVQTLAGKFCEEENLEYTLNKPEISKWFGIMTLKKMMNSASDKDLLLNWKLSLPPFFNTLLDLKALQGHYYRPHVGTVQYLNPSGLSQDIHSRIKEMFKLVKEWDYEEFLPFVEKFIPSTKKPDAVILKYAKKRRNGKRFIVCPR